MTTKRKSAEEVIDELLTEATKREKYITRLWTAIDAEVEEHTDAEGYCACRFCTFARVEGR